MEKAPSPIGMLEALLRRRRQTYDQPLEPVAGSCHDETSMRLSRRVLLYVARATPLTRGAPLLRDLKVHDFGSGIGTGFHGRHLCCVIDLLPS